MTFFNQHHRNKSSSLGVVIVSDILSFPEGYAATNYIRLIGRGLIYAGARVQLLLPVFTEKPQAPLNVKGKGIYESIQFEYTTETPVPPKNFFIRQCKKLRSIFMFPYRLLQLRKKGELGVVILYSRNYSLFFRLLILSRILHVPIVVYMSEWTLSFAHRTDRLLASEKRFYGKALSSAHGIVVISEFLENLCQKAMSHADKQIPLLRIPILVNQNKFVDIAPAKFKHPYVLYSADLDHCITEALFLVEAFSKLSTIQINHNMVMIGKSSTLSRKRIMDSAAKANIKERVHIITNFLPEKELLSYYAGAAALLAPLRNDVESLARFPFKIGYYLMSSRPVVSCQVGEVAHFLKDKETAFLSEAGSVTAFAEKIKEALTSDRRESIGKAGQQIAKRHFDYRAQGQRLHKFLSALAADSRAVK